MEKFDPVRLTRAVVGAAVGGALAVSIVSCSGSGSNTPSTARPPSTTTTSNPTPGASPPPVPTEKSSPICGKLFTPTVLAPAGMP